MRDHTCRRCGKRLKNLSGYVRHERTCKSRLAKSQWASFIPHNEDVKNEVQQGPVLIQLEGRDLSNDGEFDFNPLQDEQTEGTDDQPITTFPTLGKASTTSSVSTIQYTSEEKRGAGTTFGIDPLHNPFISGYSPFASETDFALAHWFLQAECTQGDIDRFFADKRLEPLHAHASFHSAKEWLELLHKIPCASNQDWISVPLNIDVGPDLGYAPRDCTVVFRDIISTIELLIGHPPFKDSLVYEPVRVIDTNNERVYNEMHTGEWWWETQNRLPADATIIPLLLSTDKTQLTYHHGDRAAWPVYITIGNLDRRTRRQQTRPGTLLLGFLPITKMGEEDIKAEVYHTAMATILQREVFLSHCVSTSDVGYVQPLKSSPSKVK
jgi:DNA polymerase IIIc chi subunit